MCENFKRILVYAPAVTLVVLVLLSAVYLSDNPRIRSSLQPQSVGLPARSSDVSPYLGIPAEVVRPNVHMFAPYSADRAGLRVRYLKNIFSTNEPDLAWTPLVQSGKSLLRWQTYDGTSGLHGILPGNKLELLDNELYDFGVGTLFVKVRLPQGAVAFILLETLIGETEPVDGIIVAKDPTLFLRYASVEYQGIRLYEQFVGDDPTSLNELTKLLSRPEGYAQHLSGGTKNGVHPLYASSTARSLLFTAMKPEIDDQRRSAAIKAVEMFVAAYLIPNKREVRPGLVSWPYNFEFVMNWGIKLSPPWYSPFPNSQVVSLSALLYRLTGKEEYAALAREAFQFIKTPIERGGAEYQVAGFRMPAEYVYQTPPLPNVRVLDGEFAVAIALYNGARLLGDSEMLQKSLQYLASLAMQMDSYSKTDGDLYFAQYIEKMPEQYYWSMWALIQNAGIITKDRRFSNVARRLARFIPAKACERFGC